MLNMERERSANLKTRLSNAERFPCTAPSINMDQHCELMDFLPKGYQYHVCTYKAVSQSGSDHPSFESTVRMSLQSKEEILVWLKSMAVTWRVAYTRPSKGQRIIFKANSVNRQKYCGYLLMSLDPAEYRCQYNTKPRETTPKPARVSKNTDCPAKLKITLVRTQVSHGQPSRSTDPHIPNYPTLVEISNIHNHKTHAAVAVRHRDACGEAVQRDTKHLPSSVLLGSSGTSCEHQADVMKAIPCDSCFFLPVNSSMRARLFQIAAGNDLILEDSVQRSVEVSDESQLTPQIHGSEISSTAAETPEDVLDIEDWHSMINEFSAMVTSNEGFKGAASAMTKTFHRLKGNPSMLQSAMYMFGCYNANSTAMQQAPARQWASNRAGPSIPAQHTSVTHQKVKFKGRRRLAAGRQKKSLSTMDHRYSYSEGAKAGTHSFSQNVEHHSNP